MFVDGHRAAVGSEHVLMACLRCDSRMAGDIVPFGCAARNENRSPDAAYAAEDILGDLLITCSGSRWWCEMSAGAYLRADRCCLAGSAPEMELRK